jgi:hypothetical protein
MTHRADPAQVRVSIRRLVDGSYTATLEERPPMKIAKSGRTAEAAVTDALASAHHHGMRGVNTRAPRTYEWPLDEDVDCSGPTSPLIQRDTVPTTKECAA